MKTLTERKKEFKEKYQRIDLETLKMLKVPEMDFEDRTMDHWRHPVHNDPLRRYTTALYYGRYQNAVIVKHVYSFTTDYYIYNNFLKKLKTNIVRNK